jgi:hypothetical protein
MLASPDVCRSDGDPAAELVTTGPERWWRVTTVILSRQS